MIDDETTVAALAGIAAIRAEMATRMAPLLRRIDVSGPGTWKAVVETAYAGGVTETELCARVDCGRSTVQRWESGQVAPALAARKVLRNMLADMMEDRARRTLSGPDRDEPSEEPVLPGI